MKSLRFHLANLAKHSVEPHEVRECFLRRGPKYLRRIRKRLPRVYQLIAQAASGRFLELLYEDQPTALYVFHAMDARPRQIKLLRKKRGL
jgi:hypothetical protein